MITPQHAIPTPTQYPKINTQYFPFSSRHPLHFLPYIPSPLPLHRHMQLHSRGTAPAEKCSHCGVGTTPPSPTSFSSVSDQSGGVFSLGRKKVLPYQVKPPSETAVGAVAPGKLDPAFISSHLVFSPANLSYLTRERETFLEGTPDGGAVWWEGSSWDGFRGTDSAGRGFGHVPEG